MQQLLVSHVGAKSRTPLHGRSHQRGNGGSCLLTSERLIFPIKAHRAWSHPPIKMRRKTAQPGKLLAVLIVKARARVTLLGPG